MCHVCGRNIDVQDYCVFCGWDQFEKYADDDEEE